MARHGGPANAGNRRRAGLSDHALAARILTSAIIPIRKSPIRWSAQCFHLRGDNALKMEQIHPVPEEEKPRVVLALRPIPFLFRCVRQRFAGNRQRVAPSVIIVNGGLISPTRRVGDGLYAHSGDGPPIPQKRRIYSR